MNHWDKCDINYLQLCRENTLCTVPACILLSAVWWIQESKGREGVWNSAQSAVSLVGIVCVHVRVCVSLGTLALTRHQVMSEDGFFDKVIGNQLCAVDQRVSCDVGQCAWRSEGHNNNVTISMPRKPLYCPQLASQQHLSCKNLNLPSMPCITWENVLFTRLLIPLRITSLLTRA